MTAWVKKCGACGAINHPSEVICRSCSVMLPNVKTESDIDPPKPSQEALMAIKAKNYKVASAPASTEYTDHTDQDQAKTVNDNNTQAVTLGAQIIRVRVEDFDMPFLSLVWLSAKIILAALPAIIIAAFIATLILGTLTALFA